MNLFWVICFLKMRGTLRQAKDRLSKVPCTSIIGSRFKSPVFNCEPGNNVDIWTKMIYIGHINTLSISATKEFLKTDGRSDTHKKLDSVVAIK